MTHPRIGDILLQMGAIDDLQLHSALAHQRQWGVPLGRILVDKCFCSVDSLMKAFSQQTGLPVINLDPEQLDETHGGMLPRKVAERYRVVPLRTEGRRNEVLVVAIAAPASLEAIDAVQKVTGKTRIRAMLASDQAIDRALGRIYGGYAKAETPTRPPLSPQPQPIPLNEIEFDLTSAPPPRKKRPVLIYGLAESSGVHLSVMLTSAGIDARVCGALEVLRCAEEDVVVAPLRALETLAQAGEHCPGKLLVIGADASRDLPRAEKLGAQGFLAAPFDQETFLRTIRRHRPDSGPATARA